MGIRGRAVILPVLAAAFVSTACSLLVSTSGLATGDASGDAGVDVVVATMDAQAADDGRAGGDAGRCTAGFCACAGRGHTYCDDFDNVPTGTDWMISQNGPSSISFDKDGTFSPPNNVLATSNALTTGNLAASIKSIAMPTVTRLRVEMDMAIEVSDTNNTMDGTHGFCPITLMMQPGDQTIRLNLYAKVADVEQLSGTTVVGDQQVDVPTGTGARARYGLWVDTEARTCGVTVDGVEKLPGCVLNAAFHGGAASAELGIIFVRPPTDAWRIRMDNVTADYD